MKEICSRCASQPKCDFKQTMVNKQCGYFISHIDAKKRIKNIIKEDK